MLRAVPDRSLEGGFYSTSIGARPRTTWSQRSAQQLDMYLFGACTMSQIVASETKLQLSAMDCVLAAAAAIKANGKTPCTAVGVGLC